MFLSAIRIGDFVYGTTGDFGPAFLTALNLETGESAWQVRGFARASLLHADGKVIVMNEDGDLALARMTPSGADILSRAKIFDTVSWTVPTLVGTTLYARDREKVVALDLGEPTAASRRATVGAAPNRPASTAPALPRTPPPPASFAGSWMLDAAASTVTDGAGFSGLMAAGAPRWIFVTQPANGTLIVESPVNTSHTRFYRPGRSTTTAIANGTITMSTSWLGATLVAEGRIAASSGSVTAVKETITRDTDALVVDIVAGDKVSRLRYVPLTTVGPCSSWPTACKKAGAQPRH
jgi:hypothetical protein